MGKQKREESLEQQKLEKKASLLKKFAKAAGISAVAATAFLASGPFLNYEGLIPLAFTV